MKSDIEIARDAELAPICQIARRAGIGEERLENYGPYIAKVAPNRKADSAGARGKLILVTAITATKAGIGKTTVSIGLAEGLCRLGFNAIVALREPSLGPCFGMKGGAAGGGYAQVLPMDKINLHFTGDFHAVTSAHNLLAAMLDNYIYQNRRTGLEFKQVLWRRVLDVNDRSLRHIVTGLGNPTDGLPAQSGFDITAASELMAILCLANDEADLRRRVSNIILATCADGTPFTVEQLGATGAVMALLADAIKPNLVQTVEQTPAIIHGGPFANIAHGCNSVIATKLALAHSDYCITEAGFGADLGAEKFLDIVCPKAGFAPDLTVIVATAQGLKMHGGVPLELISQPDLEGLERGLENLRRHVENLRKFGQSVAVVFNRFPSDTDAEMQLLHSYCTRTLRLPFAENLSYALGGRGAEDMARMVVTAIDTNPSKPLRTIYNSDLPLREKIERVACEIYGASQVTFSPHALRLLEYATEQGMGHFPVCIAKTQYSFSADSSRYGAVSGFTFDIKDIAINGGAEMIVALAGDMMRMPGLPKRPNALGIDCRHGNISGLS
ncbi:MAG: formate--tetrahydrofolate ligase [Firmicutes bacterium]|nr:formate--tetrahydrofolate ligase [Bacillota bacterium]MCM1401383.1 formate--tetrahydrofolate ligase [Bacteroides sp.]MCM1477868.1 formate--tetrahydrofolate ligase [Bacteroides sp.]